MTSVKVHPLYVDCIALLAAFLLAAFFLGCSHYFWISGCHMPREWKVEGDLQMLARDLEMYQMLNAKLPTTTEGLDALVHLPRSATKWYQMIKQIPEDLWGHPYRYRADSSDPKGYDLYSLGRDGVESADDIHFCPNQ